MPGNGILLRPRVAGPGRFREWPLSVARGQPHSGVVAPVPSPVVVPDVSRLMPDAPVALPPRALPRAVGRPYLQGILPHCRQGEVCADDYPLAEHVTEVTLDPTPDTLGARAAAIVGLPWATVRFRVPSGTYLTAAPWDMTVDADGVVVSAMRTSVMLTTVAAVAFAAWTLGWLVERTMRKAWVFDWYGDFATLVNGFLSGAAAIAVLHLAGADEAMLHGRSALLLLLVPVTNRTRGRLMAAAFAAWAVTWLCAIPVGPPAAAIAAGHATLGVGAWDVVGTTTLALAATAVALFGGARHLPVDVHVSGGRSPLVQDVRVVG